MGPPHSSIAIYLGERRYVDAVQNELDPLLRETALDQAFRERRAQRIDAIETAQKQPPQPFVRSNTPAFDGAPSVRRGNQAHSTRSACEISQNVRFESVRVQNVDALAREHLTQRAHRDWIQLAGNG